MSQRGVWWRAGFSAVPAVFPVLYHFIIRKNEVELHTLVSGVLLPEVDVQFHALVYMVSFGFSSSTQSVTFSVLQ